MPKYQMTLLSKSDTDKDAVKDLIGKLGGEVVHERALGQKPLAYPIKKERVAQFTLLSFTMEKEGILELNKELLLSGHTLRHMITTEKAKAPVMTGLLETRERPAEKVALSEEAVAATSEPKSAAKKEKPVKKTKAQEKVEKAAAQERQKRIEAELEKILREE